jgi:hypothetical protein
MIAIGCVPNVNRSGKSHHDYLREVTTREASSRTSTARASPITSYRRASVRSSPERQPLGQVTSHLDVVRRTRVRPVPNINRSGKSHH